MFMLIVMALHYYHHFQCYTVINSVLYSPLSVSYNPWYEFELDWFYQSCHAFASFKKGHEI